ncbi:MAG: hypothetical protein AAFY88_15030, partial [Acidobacteriota bacterium]
MERSNARALTTALVALGALFAASAWAQETAPADAPDDPQPATKAVEGPAGLLQSFDDLVEVSEVFIDVLATDAD